MATTTSASPTAALTHLFATLRSLRGSRRPYSDSVPIRASASDSPEADRDLQRQLVDLRAAWDYAAMEHRLR
jgi:hypothetical protein